MKRIYILLFPLLLCLSCSKDMLDTKPNDRYTEDTFWTTEKNAMAGLSGCYASLRLNGIYGNATPLLEETATPNAYNYDNSQGFSVIGNGSQTSNNSTIITQRYAHAYSGIGRCNSLLKKIDLVPVLNEDLKERMKAEAKFLRALYYSLLQMYYGGVPLILDPPAADQALLPRNTREEVVDQILQDLHEAAAVLPFQYTGDDIGRATKGAALGLKARILLFEASPLNNTKNEKQKWTAAAAAAKEVMDMTSLYSLFPNYRNLFYAANEGSRETIFDVQFKSPEVGSHFDVIGAQSNTNAPVKGLIDAYGMKDGLSTSQSPLYNANNKYLNRDPRMYQTIVYPGDTFMGRVTTATSPFKVTGYGIKKYTIFDKEANNTVLIGGRSDINYMVIRFADILLMYAEAKNEELETPDQSIYQAVEAIRERAGLVPFQLTAGQTKAQMREIIRKERRVELAGEGFYYTDIRRWKIAEEVMNATIYDSQDKFVQNRRFNSNRDYWWPIPLGDLDLNPNLKQNPNY